MEEIVRKLQLQLRLRRGEIEYDNGDWSMEGFEGIQTHTAK